MPDKSLRQTLAELDAALDNDQLDPQDRARLQGLQAALEAALHKPEAAAPSSLRADLDAAIARAERAHPELTGVLSRVLDALRDLGV